MPRLSRQVKARLAGVEPWARTIQQFERRAEADGRRHFSLPIMRIAAIALVHAGEKYVALFLQFQDRTPHCLTRML